MLFRSNQLFELELVQSIPDFFRLDEQKLSQVEGFKEKSISRLLNSIEKAKKMNLSQFLEALGIRYVGAQTALLLAQNFLSLEALYQLDEQKLISINGIGQKVAKQIALFFADTANKQMIQDLLNLGIDIKEEVKVDLEKAFFKDKRFVLTGTLQNYSRDQAAKLIRERGGQISSSLSKKTDFLLLGESPGSKLEKANKLGVSILDEPSFEKEL